MRLKPRLSPVHLRRSLGLFAAYALVACAGVAQAASFTMFRDPGCGCCLAWTQHVEGDEAHEVERVDHPDMGAIKTKHGVPDDLWSCHTMLADGYVIEGHVPRADIERLLRERPEIAEAALEEESDRIRVTLTDGQANGGMIAEIIVSGGLQLTGLEEDEMDLEDVFLQVTRGETQ